MSFEIKVQELDGKIDKTYEALQMKMANTQVQSDALVDELR